MTTGWITRPLGSITTKIGSGATPLGGEGAYRTDGISLIRSLNVYDDGFREAKLAKIDGIQASRLANVTVEPQDVLLNITGASVARCCLVPDFVLPARVNQHVAIVRPIREILTPAFLHYLLTSRTYKDQLLQTGEDGGSTRQALTKAQIQDFCVQFPQSVCEQQRIVDILDEAFASIATAKANTEKNLQNARDLFGNYLHAVFSEQASNWPRKRIPEVSLTFGRGKSKHRPRNDPQLFGGEYPFIQTGDVRNAGQFITSYSQTYNDAGLSQSKLWPRGTICITIAANIAETGILDFEACFPDSVIGIVVNEKITSSSYLEYLLQSFKSILQAEGKGSAQDNINLGTFEDLTFPFPDLELQARIVSQLDSIAGETSRLEMIYRKKLAALDELKKSLLHQAFIGQL